MLFLIVAVVAAAVVVVVAAVVVIIIPCCLVVVMNWLLLMLLSNKFHQFLVKSFSPFRHFPGEPSSRPRHHHPRRGTWTHRPSVTPKIKHFSGYPSEKIT